MTRCASESCRCVRLGPPARKPRPPPKMKRKRRRRSVSAFAPCSLLPVLHHPALVPVTQGQAFDLPISANAHSVVQRSRLF